MINETAFSRNGTIMAAPKETIEESHGKNTVWIDLYQLDSVFLYGIRAKFGRRAWAKCPHPEDATFLTITEAKKAARADLKKWCFDNRLKKQFFEFDIISCKQLELF